MHFILWVSSKDVSGGLPTFISPWIDGKKAVMVNGGQLTKADVISVEEHEKEFLYRMLYGSQKIRNEKNSADPR